MTIHYMDGGKPFETQTDFGAPVTVVGYDPGTNTFLAMNAPGETWWGTAANFISPPPIPAAARKPQVGEVWLIGVGRIPVLLVSCTPDSGQWWYLRPDDPHARWCRSDDLVRPATPPDAEPFRPILDGLERSLGEA